MVALQDWERVTEKITVEAGKYIFEEGDKSDEMYLVASGRIMIAKDAPGSPPIFLGYCKPGEILGELSLLNDSPRTASALALEESTLYRLSREEFWQLMSEDLEFQKTVIATLVEHLLESHDNRQARTEWEYDVLVRFDNLSSEHQQLAEVLRMRREMTQFLIHDLRSPLSLVLMSLSLFKSDADFDPDSQFAQYLDMANNGIQRMMVLIDTILALDRMDQGRYRPRFEATDIFELTKSVTERFQSSAAGRNITLTFAEGGEPPAPASVDRNSIDRVLSNLIDNAIKFTPGGGGVTVKVWQEGQSVFTSVSDTGPGILLELRDNIFDRYSQTEAGYKSRGFGLGLAYCKAAVTTHRGKIWIEDGDDGSGTKCIYSLPLTQPETF